jgi:hypothetical protein
VYSLDLSSVFSVVQNKKAATQLQFWMAAVCTTQAQGNDPELGGSGFLLCFFLLSKTNTFIMFPV